MSLRQSFESLLQHFTRLMTRPVDELTRWQRSVRYMIDLFRHCGRQLLQDRAEEMAAALTYRTIFSLIPLFVLGLVVFRIFGDFEDVQKTMQTQLYSFFGIPGVTYVQEVRPGEEVALEVPDPRTEIHKEEQKKERAAAGVPPDPSAPVEERENRRQFSASLQLVLTRLTAEVAKLNFASLGVMGALLLIYAAMALALAVEYDFNIICKAPHGRAWHLRIAIYWSIITLGSGLLTVSLYLTGRLVSWVGDVTHFPIIVPALSRLLAFFASWFLLLLLYRLMPNTRVRLRTALVGSFVAAVLWESGKVGFQSYVNHALPYSGLYGTFGLLPLFLFWVYLSWLIVLFGLELAFALQTLHGKVPTKAEDEPLPVICGDPDWFIPILTQIGQAFAEGKTVDQQEIADRLGLPSRIVSDFGGELVKAGLAHRIDGEACGYVLARPPDRISIAEVLELGRQLSWKHNPPANRANWDFVERLYQAQRNAVGEATLATLIDAPPSRSASV